MQRLALSPLAFLASISLLANLSACSILTGGSPALPDPESPTIKEVPTSTEILPATVTVEPTVSPSETPLTTETPVPNPVEFPAKYPVEVSHSYSAEVGGMEIPVSIGLTKQIMTRSSEPITDIQIAPDTVPLVGDYFLHLCYHRYTEIQGNAGVSYADYLKLVAEGKGEVQIAAFDGADPNGGIQIMTVHPEKGVSFVFLDGPTLPIELNKYGLDIYIGVSGGKFQLVLSLASYKVASEIASAQAYGRDSALSWAIGGRLQALTLLADGKNECIEALDYNRSCGMYRVSPTVAAYFNPLNANIWPRSGGKGQAFIVNQK